MSSEKSLYSSMETLKEPITMLATNNARYLAKAKGTISFFNANKETKSISDMLYVSKIKKNILLIAIIIDLNHVANFTKIGVEFLNNSRRVFDKGERRDNLYKFSALIALAGVETTKLLHESFGHIGLHF